LLDRAAVALATVCSDPKFFRGCAMTTMKRLGMAGGLVSMLAFGGCAETHKVIGHNDQSWTMQSEEQKSAFSATAKVEVENGNKPNRELKVEAERLAPAQTVYEGTSTYVVWLKPTDGKPVNIGILTPDKNLKAALKTSTPYSTFEIMVTAEDSAQPQAPTMGHEILSTNVVVPS
jgi:hypothetical protein